jgi:hypothetical protein
MEESGNQPVYIERPSGSYCRFNCRLPIRSTWAVMDAGVGRNDPLPERNLGSAPFSIVLHCRFL